MLGGACETVGDWDGVGSFYMSACFPPSPSWQPATGAGYFLGLGATIQTASTSVIMSLVYRDLHPLPRDSMFQVPEFEYTGMRVETGDGLVPRRGADGAGIAACVQGSHGKSSRPGTAAPGLLPCR